MQDTNQPAVPESWLGFKLINQAAADEMSASVLPAANSLSGRVWLALTDSDGDPLFVAGIVVAVTFTAAAVRYSVAFPVAPQPREGETLYAVVENVESGLVLAELPEDETVFDAVLTEDAAALIPLAEVVPVPAPVLDGVDSKPEQLAARRDALAGIVDGDPLAALAVAREVIDLAGQVLNAAPLPVAGLSEIEWENLKADIISSMVSIVGIDKGQLPGMDRSLFVSSIAGKIRRQFNNGKLALAGTALAFVEHSQKSFPKPVFAPANKLWKDVNWQDYAGQFKAPPELDAAPVAAAVAVLTGDELGQFQDTAEGRKARREAAKGYFKEKLLGQSVFNASLDSNIEFNSNGMKKMLSFSADSRKLKLIPALPKVLASAVDTRTLPHREGDSTIKAVHVLKGAVTLEGADLTVRVIVKERVDGSYFYDHSVNKEDLGGNTEILDSADAAELSLLALLCPEPTAQQVLMDSVSPSGEIFNLFIDGEMPEAIAQEVDAAPVNPAPIPKTSMEIFIKVAADTIDQLRRIDVYRVLNSLAADNIDGVTRSNLATYIATSRPDLAREVADVMAEEWASLGWTLTPAAEPVAVVERTDGGELLVPNKDDAPKELTVPPIPTGDTSERGQSPARAADLAFLNSIISRSVDMWDDALANKIEGMGTTYENDAEVMEVWGRAIAAYTDFMVAAMG
ncbi:MAG: hypothetical protein WKG03_00660 [Telluria sp.]